MSRTLSLFACLALCFLALDTAQAATLNVPAQYATIQAAVNASADGDTVLVADGTYTGPGDVDIDFGGKNITVTSQHGPASTIIDCQANANTLSHRGFIMQSGEMNATISGFTVKNGYQVQNDSGVASGSGGGIYLGSNAPGSSLTISNCIITNCLADSGYNGGVGGGIYASTSSSGAASAITISNCTITSNTAVFDGGGIDSSAVGNGTITITGCTITGNTAADGPSIGNGGGVYDSTDSPVSGGGSGAILVSDCTIANNTAAYEGGGVYNSVNNTYGTIDMINCTVTGNSAGTRGGGAYDYGGAQTTTNCSFTANSGGGLLTSTVAYMNNVILYGDTGGEFLGDGTTARNCDIQGGLPAGTTDGGGNIDADPLWVNPPSDLHLQASSPCIGAGTANGASSTDKDGKTRPNPPSIGAYEYAAGGTNAALKAITATPTSLTGGPYVYFTASLTGKTASTATITLTSSNPAALSVPSSVTIGAGYGSVTFHGASHPVTAVTPVTLTATYNGVSQTVTVTVNPPGLDELTVTPTSITGGGTANLETILNSKATVNARIALSSSNPSVLPVPAAVAINAGYSTKTITLTSTTVTTATVVTITGTYNGVSASVNITVSPVSLASVTANPVTVQGGAANSALTVALTAKATSTATMTLTSSNPAALSVPSSAAIGAGYQSKTVTATSHTVTSTTTVTLTATYNGVSKTATVTVTPANATVVPTALSFNPSPSYSSGQTTGTVTLSGAAPTGGAAVSISYNGTAFTTATVPAGQTSAAFYVDWGTVTTATTYTMGATYNGTTVTTPVTVEPTSVTIVSLVYAPNPVKGGNNAVGTVTLSAAAPPGGAVITLSGAVSYSFVVPVGQTSASYTQPTGVVSSTTTYTFNAAYNGASVSATLTATP